MIRLQNIEKSFPTQPSPTSVLRQIVELFRKLNQEGTTVVQVTHSEANAAYGHWVVRLRDGWLE